MALSDSDLEGFTLVSERKPDKAGGVSVATIPAQLVEMLTVEAPKALADPDYELILKVPVRDPEPPEGTSDEDRAKAVSEAHKKAVDTSKLLALYATAWGKGQDPKLYITKVPNRKDDKDEPMARLKVRKDEDVATDNRPGRRR